MSNKDTIYICDDCGNEFPKWSGQCPICKNWNTIRPLQIDTSDPQDFSPTKAPKATTPKQTLEKSDFDQQSTQIKELDRVLGGGLTAGSVILLAGQPGIGKSTLLSQLSIKLSPKESTLYICSEENNYQVSKRIKRLSPKSDSDSIKLLETSSTPDIIKHVQKNHHDIDLLIVDSIQSLTNPGLSSSPGTPSQIRTSAKKLINLAKSTQLPIILVGHVTKSGTIAGPKLLEHMVDVVLELEGNRHHDLRLLRGLKNRFGPTDETGLFKMSSKGLKEIQNPGQAFLSDSSQKNPGSALSLIMEGTRPLLVEIQALTVYTELNIPRRVGQGISKSKLQLICAVLTKHLNLKLGQRDVFVNVTGGLNLSDPAADLAIALAILSSYKDKPLPLNSLSIGELGLLGEIRPVPYFDKRLKEAKTLGYKQLFHHQDFSTLKKLSSELF